MNPNRTPFEFDGGTVRFTVAGQLIANISRIAFWLLMIAATIAAVILLVLTLALYMAGAR